MRQLEGRPNQDLREVLLATQTWMSTVAGERTVLAAAALASCEHDRGGVSREIYWAWREAQDRPDQWPTCEDVRAVYGTWTAATASVQVAGARFAITDRRLRAIGPAYTRDEIMACVAQWLADPARMNLEATGYLEWAHEQMLLPGRTLPRYVRSLPPVRRWFESWSALLVALGADVPTDDAVEDLRQRCIFWLKEAAKERGLPLTTKKYLEFGQDRRAAGETCTIPSPSRVHHVFGSWIAGLHAAGLGEGRTEGIYRRPRAGVRSDEDLLGYVARAMREYGPNITGSQYRQWGQDRRQHEEGTVPTKDQIADRFGGWRAARNRVQAASQEGLSA